MNGYAGQFVRVCVRVGSDSQGGSNYGIKIIEDDKGNVVITAQNDGCLIDGVHSRSMIIEPIDNIKEIQVDRLNENNQPSPDYDYKFRNYTTGKLKERVVVNPPDRGPIATAAAVNITP